MPEERELPPDPIPGTEETETTSGTTDDNKETSDATKRNWVKDALNKAKEFLNGNIEETDSDKIVTPVLETVRSIIRGVNNILLVLLATLSAISLSVVGIRYIASGATPIQKRIAIDSLHTVFKGMFIGFGAFIIWRIAMGFVEIVLDSF